MSTDSLFSDDSVGAALSPRLQWVAKHQVRTHHAPPSNPLPFCCWLPANDALQNLGVEIPNDPQLCGYGNTEEEAMVALAQVAGIPLWNEVQSPT